MRSLGRALVGIAVFTIVSASAAAGSAQAQQHALDRGSFILGGTTGLSSHTYSILLNGQREDRTYTHAYFSPRVQYFVVPGLAVGGQLDVTHARSSGSPGYEGHSATQYGAGPTLSYFFGSGEQRFVPYLSGQAAYAAVHGEEYYSYGYGGSAGVLYMLTRSVGLDGALFYRTSRYRYDGDDEPGERVVGLAVGFSAFAF